MCDKKTPCDFGDNSCPFDARSWMDCRNQCGLGVDEDGVADRDHEDPDGDDDVDESMNPYDGTYDWENDVERM